MEREGRGDSYLFGFEESYGYLSGTYVRDKDAVVGAFLICEMTAFYRARGLTLLERLDELYGRYGYCLNTLHSYTFEGTAGLGRMQHLMHQFRHGQLRLGQEIILNCLDYMEGVNGLPKADVLKFCLKDNSFVIIRPSGTEPKIKVYISICEKSRSAAALKEQAVVNAMEQFMNV